MAALTGFEVFLKYLPSCADEDAVHRLFAACGEVVGEVRLLRDSGNGHCKGVGWITFAQRSGAEAACAMDGVSYEGRHVQITMAKQVNWTGGHAGTVGGVRGTVQAPGTHTPAMAKEVVESLIGEDADGVYVDGTFGRGGHSRCLLAALGPQGSVHAFDLDPEAVAAGRRLEREDQRFRVHHAGFGGMDNVLSAQGLAERVAGVFLDLGLSSPQLDESARGFRPEQDGPLDLRFDLTKGRPASDFLRDAPRSELLRVLQTYGDPSDPHAARRVTDALCLARASGGPGAPKTTRALSDLVAACRGYEFQAMHPSKATFQALRIHLNDEFDQLRKGMAAALTLLRPGGRLVILSWKHSECALIVEFLRSVEVAPPLFPLLCWHKDRSAEDPAIRARVRKRWGFAADAAKRPGTEELRDNSRARSAVLHVLRKQRGCSCRDLENLAAAVFEWPDAVSSSSSTARGRANTENGGEKALKRPDASWLSTASNQATEAQEEGEQRCGMTARAITKRKAAEEDASAGKSEVGSAPGHERRRERGGEGRAEVNKKRVSAKIQRKETASDFGDGAGPPKEEEPVEALQTILEDDHIWAINKAAGTQCHPSPGYWDDGTVAHALVGKVPPEMLEPKTSHTGEADSFIPRAIVHRLDKGTTGVLLIAKTPQAEHQLTGQFKARSIQKRYVALLLGHPGGTDGAATVRVRAPIGRDHAHAGKMFVAEDGKAAHSVIHVHAHCREHDVALVTVELHTGRQHQIRVHCAHLGAAVAGDEDYGDATTLRRFRKAFGPFLCRRPLLHCWNMNLPHPAITSQRIDARAPLPPDICQVVARLWPKLSSDPQHWPVARQWRIKLRGLPFSTKAADVVEFLSPKLLVGEELVRVARKNAKRRALKPDEPRPGEAEVVVEATATAVKRVRELDHALLGGRWVEVAVEPLDGAAEGVSRTLEGK